MYELFTPQHYVYATNTNTQWCRKPKFGNLVINDEAAAALIEETLLEPLMNIRICISILLVHTALGLSNFGIDTEWYCY